MTNASTKENQKHPPTEATGVFLPFGDDFSLLRSYIDVIRRRIWVIATVFLVFFTVGVIRAFRAEPVYQAGARVMVETQMARPTRFDAAVEENLGWDPEYYQTQVELIQSRAVLEKVLEQEIVRSYLEQREMVRGETSVAEEIRQSLVGLIGGTSLKPSEQWERLRGLIKARHIEDTRFILIVSECGNPNIAAILANAAANAFKEYYLQKKQNANDDVFGFLTREIKQQEEKLNKAVEELQKFREKSGNISFSDDKKDQPVIESINRLNKEFTETQLNRIDLEAQKTVVENMLRQSATGEVNYTETIVSVPFVREDASVKDKLDKLSMAEKNVAVLANTYGPAHPQLAAAKKDVERLERELEQIVRATIASLDNRLLTLKNKEEDLASQIEKLREEALVVTREAFELSRLENEVERHKKIYDALVQRLMEIDVNSGFNRTNVEIVEPASPPKFPIRPNRGRMAFMAAFFGIIIGFALGFLVEHLDDTIKTPEDLRRKLSVPLIGFIPLVQEENNKENKPTDMGLISVREPLSSVSEAYRAVRTNLFFSVPSGKTKTLAFTSCGPSEGKTTTVTNLALVMAMSGKRTLLIDADLHRPSVHRLCGIEKKIGLTDVLVGEVSFENAIAKVPINDERVNNLDVLTAGSDTPNPSELLGSEAMIKLLRNASQKYDWILLDTPPVFFVSDASVASAIVDGVVLVVRVGINNGSRLRRLMEHLELLNVRVIGVVLNGIIIASFGRYYSDYYHHGYARYAKDYHKSYYKTSRKPRETEQITKPEQKEETTPRAMQKQEEKQKGEEIKTPVQEITGEEYNAKKEEIERHLEELKKSYQRFEDHLQGLLKDVTKNKKSDNT